MSSIFDFHDDAADPPWTLLDTLDVSHGINPEHLMSDPDAPLVVVLGSGKYISTADLRRLMHDRASDALDIRMSRRSRRGDDPARDAFLDKLERDIREDEAARAASAPQTIAA